MSFEAQLIEEAQYVREGLMIYLIGGN